jgi:ribonuclease P protein component
MLKILPIKKSAEFLKIGKKGQKFYSHTILLLSFPTPQNYLQNKEKNLLVKDFCRVGFTVAKTVSKLAVERNQAKRRLREIFKKLAPTIAKNHHDYVIIARKEIVAADFQKISGDLKFCLTKIHQNKNLPSHAAANKTK